MKLGKKKHYKSDKLKEIWEKTSNVKTDTKTTIIMTEVDEMLTCSIKCHVIGKIM